MELKIIEEKDTEAFSKLILAMYKNLDNFEWFGLMPTDVDTLKSMISNPRFFILGVWENEELMGVSSLDYKCGKLIGKIEFPKECNTEKLVEIAFTLVHPNHRGKHIAQIIVEKLIDIAKEKGFESVFAKIHIDNIPSKKTFLKLNFVDDLIFKKEVHRSDFEYLLTQSFVNDTAKSNAKLTLTKNEGEIPLTYQIFYKVV